MVSRCFGWQLAVAEERLRASQSEMEAMHALMHTISLQPAGLEPASLGQQMSARIAQIVKQRHEPIHAHTPSVNRRW
jgi:hypothetical protein